MKKYNLFLFIAIIVTFYSCQEEEITILDSSQAINNENFKVEVIDNMLYFESRNEYEKAIDYLAQLGDENFENWEKEISFNSMRANFSEKALEKMGVEDDLIATLLNPEGLIRIGDNVFEIDMSNESVSVTPISDFSNVYDFGFKKKSQEYSTEDDVLDIIDGVVTEEEYLNRRKRHCRRVKSGPVKWQVPYGVKIKVKVVYQRFGIYKSLQAKIKREGSQNGIELSMKVVDFRGKKSFWRNKRRRGTISGQKSGTGREYNIRPYNRTRGLKDFLYRVQFEAYRSDDGWYKGATLKIECSR